MANVENQDPSGQLISGGTLAISGAASEDEVLLAVENYLRLHKKEGMEFALGAGEKDGVFYVTLS